MSKKKSMKKNDEHMRCPKCGNADRSRMIGIEYQGRYDGVSEWHCKLCNTRWDRWTGEAKQ